MIYGSSRLGTKDYLPGQLYSLVDYQQAQPVIDTSILNGRRPWYSGGFNDDIEPGATTVWGNTQTGPFLASERIGEKQYELTNHLGNVQATVSDNRYEVADKSTDSILAYHPALRSAYDYYPFGMLMPGRYVSDTSRHCVTVTRPTWVWKEVTVACWDVYAWEWPSLELVGEATARVDGDAVEINAPNASDAVGYTFPVTPNVQQTLTLDIERMNLNDKASVEVMEQQGKEWVTLAERPIEVSSGGLEIPFKPKGNYIKVVWHGRILVWVRKDCISKLEWVEEDQLVTICDGDKDKYRFGYNGQEKVNEWAGIGNCVDFGARGLDTRVGRWLSVDQFAAKYPWNSPYAFAENRVIDGIDLEGLEWSSTTDKDGTTHLHAKIAVMNASKIVTDPKQIENIKEQLSKSFSNNFSGTFGGKSYKADLTITPLNKQFDKKHQEQTFKIVFVDVKTNDRNEYKGGEAYVVKGGSQTNLIRIALSVNGNPLSLKNIGRAFTHEMGHSAGLYHPWQEENAIKDIQQGDKKVKDISKPMRKTIRGNLMNSAENPRLRLQNTDGNELTPGQMKEVKERVETEQPQQ